MYGVIYHMYIWIDYYKLNKLNKLTLFKCIFLIRIYRHTIFNYCNNKISLCCLNKNIFMIHYISTPIHR